MNILYFSPNLLMVGFIASIGLIIALGIKRQEAPLNFYLLSAFVSGSRLVLKYLNLDLP